MEVLESRGDPGDHVTAARRLVRTLRDVRAIARRRERAVIVTHLSERGSFLREGLVARYANHLGLPVIAHLHGSEYAQYERSNPESVARVLRACTKVITLSQDASEISARHVPADRIELVPTRSRRERRGRRRSSSSSAASSRTARASMCCRMPGAKSRTDTRSGSSSSQDRSATSTSSTAHCRARAGSAVSRMRRLMELLERAEIAVLPSRDEAMPMFILEAMARRGLRHLDRGRRNTAAARRRRGCRGAAGDATRLG